MRERKQSLQWADVCSLQNVRTQWWEHSHKIQHANKHYNVPPLKCQKISHLSNEIPWGLVKIQFTAFRTWHTRNCINVVTLHQAEQFLKCRWNPVFHVLWFNVNAGLQYATHWYIYLNCFQTPRNLRQSYSQVDLLHLPCNSFCQSPDAISRPEKLAKHLVIQNSQTKLHGSSIILENVMFRKQYKIFCSCVYKHSY